SRPVQNAAPAPRKIRIRCSGCSDATLMAAHNSVSSSIVSAFRRSGRLKVTTLICGDSFSTKTTGMGFGYKSYIVTSLNRDITESLSRLNLNDPCVEMRFRHRARDVFQKADQHVARFVRLNDGVHPAASGAVTNIGLLFVTLF